MFISFPPDISELSSLNFKTVTSFPWLFRIASGLKCFTSNSRILMNYKIRRITYFPSFPPLAISLESPRIDNDRTPSFGKHVVRLVEIQFQSPTINLLDKPPHAEWVDCLSVEKAVSGCEWIDKYLRPTWIWRDFTLVYNASHSRINPSNMSGLKCSNTYKWVDYYIVNRLYECSLRLP